MKYSLFFLLTTFSTVAFGQTLIQGKVTDTNGQTIPMASVSIKDSYDGTSADENGHFLFTTTEEGTHTLVVKSLGMIKILSASSVCYSCCPVQLPTQRIETVERDVFAVVVIV